MKRFSSHYAFYSWNGDIEREELEEQMRGFAAQGFTGLFIHARAGLEIPYFGRTWFERFGFAVSLAKELNMEIGIYDENGWPSGFGNGAVNGLGEKYWQKRLALKKDFHPSSYKKLLTAYKKDGARYVRCAEREGELFAVIEEIPQYVDLLSPFVTEAFLESTHEVYRKHFGGEFGKTIKYLFTDEPQLAAPYAYTEGIEEIFFGEYGYDMLEELWRFAFETREFSKFHFDYRSLVSKLFHRNYTQKVAEWCKKNNLCMTGHFACEENTVTLNLNGGPMNGYESMQVPGIDAIGRRRSPDTLFEQAVGAKNIFEKSDVLSETFGCSGWGTTFDDFRFYWSNQAVRGVSLPCLHLSAFSMRGIRKRDYPAFFSYQEPWWQDFKPIAEYMKFSAGFVRGERFSDILVVDSEFSSYGLSPECFLDTVLAKGYAELISSLTKCQVAFDIIGGGLFEKYASVENDKIIVRHRTYKGLILSSSLFFTQKTLAVIHSAISMGIPVALVNDFRSIAPDGTDRIFSDVASVCDYLWKIEYKRKVAAYRKDGRIDGDIVVRKFERGYAFFNTDRNAEKTVRIYAANERALKVKYAENKKDGHIVLNDGYADVCLYPGQLLLAESAAVNRREDFCEKRFLLEPLEIVRRDPNALTLDKACYSLDGKEFSASLPVMEIEETAAKNKYTRIFVRYEFNAEFIPSDLCIAAERGAKKIEVNGKPCDFSSAWYVDKSIGIIPIAGCAKKGVNTVELFFEAQDDNIRTPEALDEENEIARNLFSYGLEIENVYVLGSFSVKGDKFATDKNVLYIENDSFVLTKENKIEKKALTAQGLWFYRGRIAVRIKIPEVKEGEKGFISLSGGGHCSASLEIDSKKAKDIFLYEKTDVSEYGGRYADLILTVSNRNLLGPHHHCAGEPSVVGGNTFRGVRGFEDEWIESRYKTSTAIKKYGFVPNELPEIYFYVVNGKGKNE